MCGSSSRVHDFALGRVGHHHFETLSPTICLVGTCATSRRRQSKPVQSTDSTVSHTSNWLKGHLTTIKHLGHTLWLCVFLCADAIPVLGYVMHEPKARALCNRAPVLHHPLAHMYIHTTADGTNTGRFYYFIQYVQCETVL